MAFANYIHTRIGNQLRAALRAAPGQAVVRVALVDIFRDDIENGTKNEKMTVCRYVADALPHVFVLNGTRWRAEYQRSRPGVFGYVELHHLPSTGSHWGDNAKIKSSYLPVDMADESR